MEQAKRELNKKMNIFDLNQDCLTSVFTYLDCNDLVNVKAAHSQFDAALEFVIRTRLFKLSVRTVTFTLSSEMRKIFKFFQFFGKYITKLYIAYEESAFGGAQKEVLIYLTYIEVLIEQFCKNTQFQYCRFEGIALQSQFFLNNKSKFESVKELHMGNYSIACDFNWVFRVFTSLKVLRMDNLISVNTGEFFQNIICSHLEILEFTGYQDFMELSPKEITTLPVNLTVKVITIDVFTTLTHTFLKHFPNVERLKFRIVEIFRVPEQLLNDLPKLKYLEIKCGYEYDNLGTFLYAAGEQNKLVSLKLYGFPLIVPLKSFEALTKLTKLEHLTLTISSIHIYPSVVVALAQLSTALISLKYFEFYGSGSGANTTGRQFMDSILQFVKNAKQLTVLKVTANPFSFDPMEFHKCLADATGHGRILHVTVYDARCLINSNIEMANCVCSSRTTIDLVQLDVYQKPILPSVSFCLLLSVNFDK